MVVPGSLLNLQFLPMSPHHAKLQTIQTIVVKVAGEFVLDTFDTRLFG